MKKTLALLALPLVLLAFSAPAQAETHDVLTGTWDKEAYEHSDTATLHLDGVPVGMAAEVSVFNGWTAEPFIQEAPVATASGTDISFRVFTAPTEKMSTARVLVDLNDDDEWDRIYTATVLRQTPADLIVGGFTEDSYAPGDPMHMAFSDVPDGEYVVHYDFPLHAGSSNWVGDVSEASDGELAFDFDFPAYLSGRDRLHAWVVNSAGETVASNLYANVEPGQGLDAAHYRAGDTVNVHASGLTANAKVDVNRNGAYGEYIVASDGTLDDSFVVPDDFRGDVVGYGVIVYQFGENQVLTFTAAFDPTPRPGVGPDAVDDHTSALPGDSTTVCVMENDVAPEGTVLTVAPSPEVSTDPSSNCATVTVPEDATPGDSLRFGYTLSRNFFASEAAIYVKVLAPPVVVVPPVDEPVDPVDPPVTVDPPVVNPPVVNPPVVEPPVVGPPVDPPGTVYPPVVEQPNPIPAPTPSPAPAPETPVSQTPGIPNLGGLPLGVAVLAGFGGFVALALAGRRRKG